MTAVVAMTRLDLLSSRPYLKQGLLLIVAATMLGLTMEDPVIVVPMMVVYAVLMSSYPFAIADKNDLDTLYAVVPVRRSAQIAARYVYALVLFLMAVAAGAVLLVAITLVRGASFPSASEGGVLLAGCFALFAVMVGLQYPIYVAFGYMRARLAAMLPFAMLMAAGMAFQSRFADLTPPPAWTALPILVGGGLVVLVASALVAERLPRREAR